MTIDQQWGDMMEETDFGERALSFCRSVLEFNIILSMS
jgi:hypothetical protein